MSYNNAFSVHKLGSLCLKIGSGSTPRGGSEVYLKNGDFALIRSQNIRNDSFDRNGLVYLNQDQADKLANVAVESNDVLLNITGDSVARCCQVDNNLLPARVNQHVVIIRPNPAKLDPRFLRYVLISPKMQQVLLNLASAGATRNALTKGMIESLEIPFPHIEKQRAIADILGCLDDKIELNRQMCKTLEDIASTLFKSWFIDFDPVKAKAAGRNPEGLSPDIADLFPDCFFDSSLGQIPKGWSVKEIGSLVEIVGGGTPNTKEEIFWKNGIHNWVTPKDLSGLDHHVLINTDRKISDAGLSKISSGLLPVGTVLLSSRAPIGYVAITQIPVSINQGFIAMKCSKTLGKHFIHQWTLANLEVIKNRANGSTFLEINKASFRPILISYPTNHLINVFDNITEQLFLKTVEAIKQINTLEETRNNLLSKLIAGELKINES